MKKSNYTEAYKWYKGKDLQYYHPSGEPTLWLLETPAGREGVVGLYLIGETPG